MHKNKRNKMNRSTYQRQRCQEQREWKQEKQQAARNDEWRSVTINKYEWGGNDLNRQINRWAWDLCESVKRKSREFGSIEKSESRREVRLRSEQNLSDFMGTQMRKNMVEVIVKIKVEAFLSKAWRNEIDYVVGVLGRGKKIVKRIWNGLWGRIIWYNW